MNLTKTHKIIISIVSVLILFGIYVLIDKRSKNNEEKKDENVNIATTTDINLKTNTGSYKIEQIPISGNNVATEKVPDLNRRIIVTAGAIVSPEAKKLSTEKITELQTRLKANTQDVLAWLDLGMYQKMAGDYEGAAISWKYVTKISPTDYISRGNLGNLYAYFLKDNGQAEVYYKEAIVKNPTQVYLYTQLAEVYRDIFKDLNKAKAIIDEGLTKVPNNPNLLQFKALLNNL